VFSIPALLGAPNGVSPSGRYRALLAHSPESLHPGIRVRAAEWSPLGRILVLHDRAVYLVAQRGRTADKLPTDESQVVLDSFGLPCNLRFWVRVTAS
jgi:hypothetical protein